MGSNTPCTSLYTSFNFYTLYIFSTLYTLLNRVRGILKTGLKATPFESEDIGKAALKDLKRFAAKCRNRGLNPQGWGDLGDLKHSLVDWESKASSGRKGAAKGRHEEWQQWAEEACLRGAKSWGRLHQELTQWRATTTSAAPSGEASGRPCAHGGKVCLGNCVDGQRKLRTGHRGYNGVEH